DLAKQMPEKLEELKRLFDLEASKYNVFPLDDRKAERANPDLAGRPSVVHGNTQLLFPGMRRVQENAVINTKNKSHSVTAEIEVPASGAKGVIAAQGGQHGWLEPVRARRKAQVLLQLRGHPAFRDHGDLTAAIRQAPGPDGVRVRRRRHWQRG